MADLRIDNGVVVTMDPGRRVIERGSVAIEKDRIVAVGPTDRVARSHPARRLATSTATAGNGLMVSKKTQS